MGPQDAPGGAVTAAEARARDEALRPLTVALRRARVAAYNAAPSGAAEGRRRPAVMTSSKTCPEEVRHQSCVAVVTASCCPSRPGRPDRAAAGGAAAERADVVAGAQSGRGRAWASPSVRSCDQLADHRDERRVGAGRRGAGEGQPELARRSRLASLSRSQITSTWSLTKPTGNTTTAVSPRRGERAEVVVDVRLQPRHRRRSAAALPHEVERPPGRDRGRRPRRRGPRSCAS